MRIAFVIALLGTQVITQALADDFDVRMKEYAETTHRDRQIQELQEEQHSQAEERYRDNRKLKCELEKLRAASRGEREPFCLGD